MRRKLWKKDLQKKNGQGSECWQQRESLILVDLDCEMFLWCHQYLGITSSRSSAITDTAFYSPQSVMFLITNDTAKASIKWGPEYYATVWRGNNYTETSMQRIGKEILANKHWHLSRLKTMKLWLQFCVHHLIHFAQPILYRDIIIIHMQFGVMFNVISWIILLCCHIVCIKI